MLADEWEYQPHPRPTGVEREDLRLDPVYVVLPEGHDAALRHSEAVPLTELAGEVWTTGHANTGWEEMTVRACRDLGDFDPDIRHRTNDSVTSLALVAAGHALTLLPQLVHPEDHPGVVVRAPAEGSVHRTIYAATRAADATRPSVSGAARRPSAPRQRVWDGRPPRPPN